MSKLSEMPYTTVEQVVEFRKAALTRVTVLETALQLVEKVAKLEGDDAVAAACGTALGRGK